MLACIQIVDEIGGEDCQSVESHIKAMQTEMKKTNPNQTLIDDRMNRTFALRRSLIMSSRIEAVLDRYPALTMNSQVGVQFAVLIELFLYE